MNHLGEFRGQGRYERVGGLTRVVLPYGGIESACKHSPDGTISTPGGGEERRWEHTLAVHICKKRGVGGRRKRDGERKETSVCKSLRF